MFAQIILDSSAVEEALTVPSAAVVEKDGAKFVFVPAGKDAPRTFTIRPVEVGRQAGDRTVIKAGLQCRRCRRLLRRVHPQERADPPE